MTDQKTVLITGAARGLGFSHARRFAAGGYCVVITDIDENAIAAAVAEIGPEATG